MKFPEKYRHKKSMGPMPATKEGDPCGIFFIPQKKGAPLRVIVSSAKEMLDYIESDIGWDHVSVSLPTRCPTWKEMCRVKDLFFEEDEVAVQFHPKKEDYINCHPFCLHIWKPEIEFPTPPKIMVGV